MIKNYSNYLEARRLGGKRQQKILFTDLSIQLKASESLLVTGPNGSGKTSLLRILAGVVLPYAGEILWQGTSIQRSKLDYMQNVHYIAHANGLKQALTLKENLQLAQCLSTVKHDNSVEFTAVLEQLQLSALQSTLTCYLSAGQKRRLALAKLFLFKKPIWILDEPLTALDLNTQNLFFACLKHHLKEGGVAIMSSHQPIKTFLHKRIELK